MFDKKAAIDDFGSLLVAGGIIIVIIFIMFFFVNITISDYEQKADVFINLEETSYSTRIILNWKTKEGIKLHESLVYHYSNEDLEESPHEELEEFFKEVNEVLLNKNLLIYDWVVLLNSEKLEDKMIRTNVFSDKLEGMGRPSTKSQAEDMQTIRNSFISLPRIIIPDGERGIIEVVIKQITREDKELYELLSSI